MNLIVTRSGKYNDINGRAANYAENDPLTTSLDYGQSLIDSGYAVTAVPHVPECFHHEPETEPEIKASKRRGKK